MPYRTAARPPPGALDTDLARFAARLHHNRREQLAVAVVGLALVVGIQLAAVTLSTPRSGGLVPVPAPRKLPPVHALVVMPCPPMEDAERLRYEQAHWVECTEGCLWYPERSSWR
jgi:hypothetical protein